MGERWRDPTIVGRLLSDIYIRFLAPVLYNVSPFERETALSPPTSLVFEEQGLSMSLVLPTYLPTHLLT